MKRILATIALLTVLVSIVFATPSVMTDPKIRFWNQAGTAPLTGGKVYTYDAGTSTPKSTYTDSTGLIQNTNPVVLDSRGEANIWLDGCYKVILKTSTGVTQWTVDNICSVSDFVDAVLSAQNEWQVQEDTPTYVSANSFSVSGDKRTSYQVGRRIKVETSGGTRYGWISASTYSVPNTTVTVFVDSGNFTGISEVSLGILSVTNPSIAKLPTVTKTTGATLTGAEVGRHVILNLSSSGTVTLPAMTTVPPGTSFNLYSIGSGSVLVSGTVGTTVNPVLYQYDIARLVSDGVNTAWQGSIESETPAAGRIVRAKSTGKIDNSWLTNTDDIVVSQITSSGTWTVPAAVDEVFFFASGGGGAGGTGDVSGSGGGGAQGNKIWWHRVLVTSGQTYSVVIGNGGAATGTTGAGGSGGSTYAVLSTDATATIFNAGGGTGGVSGDAGRTAGTYGVFTAQTTTAFHITPDVGENTLYSATVGTGGAAAVGGNGGGRQRGTGGAAGAGNPGTAATAGSGSGGGGGGYSAGAVNNGGNGAAGYIYVLYFTRPD